MLLAASVMVLGVAACSGSEDIAAQAIPTETAASDGTIETAVDPVVTSFVEKASWSNMYEIEASKLALERSKVQSVKDFAQMMIDDHSSALTELESLSNAAMVTPPIAMDDDHKNKIESLRNAAVDDFDDMYIDQQTAAHDATLDLLQDFSANGQDAGLRSFAAKVAPTVEAHLTAVRALDKSDADDITESQSES